MLVWFRRQRQPMQHMTYRIAGNRIATRGKHRLYSSVVERQSCKLKVLGSIPSGGSFLMLCQRANDTIDYPGNLTAGSIHAAIIKRK